MVSRTQFDGLKGASFIKKLSKKVVTMPFMPCIMDATTPEDAMESLTPAGIDDAFAVVERRRQDLGVLSPYPDVMPLEAHPALGDSDLSWVMSKEREMTPHQLYFYKIKELETRISHDSIAISREKDPIMRAKLILSLEVMKRKLHELREICGMGGNSNKLETPLLADGDMTKELDEDLAERADATGRSAPPGSPMYESTRGDEDIPSYKDLEEEEEMPASTSTAERVMPTELALFDSLLDNAASMPLPDDHPV